MLRARTTDGTYYDANTVSDRDLPFRCPHCREPVTFVDSQLRVKHFRHRVESECESEPETEEHVYYKRLVHSKLLELNNGIATLEEPLRNMRPDVYWKIRIPNELRIAFEIQASSVDLRIYEEKLREYEKRGIFAVYLFVPGNFLSESRDNIYSLKEIEKRFFTDHHFGDEVIAAYFDGDRILVPALEAKYAKGGRGLCSHRFVMDWKNIRRVDLGHFLAELPSMVPSQLTGPCEHIVTEFVHSPGKIDRFKEACADCGKFG